MKNIICFILLSTLCYNSSGQNVGIGTNNPGAKLDVNGQIKIQGGQPGMNKVLTSDANGLATWEGSVSSYDLGDSVVPANNSDIVLLTSSTSNWKGGKMILVVGHCTVKSSIPLQAVTINVEVWIEYNHPTYGNIKFKNVYKNPFNTDGVLTLPVNCLLPSVNGLAFTVGARNINSTYAYYNENTSSWTNAPLPLHIAAEVQGTEL